MTRLFGTDGIRGVANVDLRPSLAFALGRATAHQVVGAGRLARRRARTPGGRATCSWPRSPPARRAWARTSTRSAIVPTPALAFLAARPPSSRPGSWSRRRTTRPRTTGSRCSTRAGLKLDDDVEDDLEAAVLRADELPGVSPDAIGRTRRGVGPARSLRRPPARRSPGPSTRRGLHVVLDTANGAAYRVAPRDPARDRRPGDRDPRRARRRQHQPRLAARRAPASLADAVSGRRRGRRVRARRRRRPVRRGRRAAATSSTATRSSGILALERLGARRARPRQPRGVGALERRAPGRGRGGGRADRPDAGRRQAHPRGDAGLGRRSRRREERPRDHPRAHDVGRRDRDRASSCCGS